MRASEKQVAYMRRLGDERALDESLAERLAGLLAAHETNQVEITMEKASEIIDWLDKLPYKAGSGAPVSTDLDVSVLREGRYAVGDVLFLVQKPEAGKWAGWTFVKNGSDYTDERYGSQRPGGTYRGSNADLLVSILEDPIEAMKHYGIITDHCGVCGRRLEDEVSVARGIGPICFERLTG
jgi:hypothetical protein